MEAISQETRQDLELARRCDRDPRARDRLVRQYAPSLYRVVRRLTGNTAEAEDVLQETFIQVFASLPSYRGEAPLSGWLRRVAVRTAMRQIKRRRRRPEVHLEVVGERMGPTSHPQHEQRATLRLIESLLQQIAPKRRAVFVLHQIEGYTLPEAAAYLGVSVTAAKKLVWRARRDLEKLARKEPAFEGWFNTTESDDE